MPALTLTVVADCDREPIHIPGRIQAHGILLALAAPADGAAVRVVAASANAPGGWQAMGALPPLDVVLADDSSGRVAAVLAEILAESAAEAVPVRGLRCRAGASWDGVLRAPVAAGQPWLLELEPAAGGATGSGSSDHEAVLDRATSALGAIQAAPDAVEAYRRAASALQSLCGFDRIMAYRFMSDWSGEVVAEAVSARLADEITAAGTEAGTLRHSYLGLCFPASDIPAQARALYAATPLRLIPDPATPPVALVDLADSGPLDLSRAVLRAVAPVHLLYLANMGVTASMSVAVTRRDGSLRALLACHHLSGPCFVGHAVRQAMVLVARALAWRLDDLDDRESGLRVARVRAAWSAVVATLPGPQAELAGPLAAQAETLLAALDVQGVAFCRSVDTADAGAVVAAFGLVPDAAACVALLAEIEAAAPAGRDAEADRMLETDRLAERFPAWARSHAQDGDGNLCGLLALALPGAAGWLLAFRVEAARVVVWAGNPDKSVESQGRGQSHGVAGQPVALTPRASFAAWREAVLGRSLPFSPAVHDAAAALRDGLADILLRRAALERERNVALRAYNDDLRFFVDSAAHDLKEPLWQVQVFAGMLADDLTDIIPPERVAEEGTLEAEAVRMVASIAQSATRMRSLIDELALFAVSDRALERAQTVRLLDVAEEALSDLEGVLLDVPDASIDLSGLGDAAVQGDPVQLRRIFQNLIGNSVKYRRPQQALSIVARAMRNASAWQVEVEDNGVGFDAAHADRLFEPFRRFAPPGLLGTTDGLGLGLAICRRLAQAHGGTITAALRHPAPGAVMRLMLPIPETYGRTQPALEDAG